MKLKEILSSIATIAILTLALVLVGCFDQGQGIVDDVIGGPGEVVDGGVDETPDPITTVGEVKKDPNSGETVDPVQPDPEPVTPGLLRPEPEYGVTYEYFRGAAIAEILPADAWVLDFPGPYREYDPPESNPTDFVGRVCMPVRGIDADNWAKAHFIAPVAKAIVTITHGPREGEQALTNEGGYYHFRDVEGDELSLRVERQWLEPKEVIASRSAPTTLQEIDPNRVFNALNDTRYNYSEVVLGRLRARNSPGMILVGLRWPDAVRFILETETLPHDLLCIRALPNRWVAGTYSPSMVVTLYNNPEEKGEMRYSVLMHEIGHARQHTDAILHGTSYLNNFNWDNTPEGKAYKVAWEKDLEEIPRERWLGTLDKSDYYGSYLHENAAEFCSMYWHIRLGIIGEESFLGGISKRAPNRYKWCQEHLATQYD